MFTTENSTKAKAQIKDGALILYLPKALKPCVWRMDLEILSETSIEIDQKDDIYILATRDINGVIKSIAGFDLKDDAQEALSLTLKALMSNSATKGESASALTAIPFGKIIKWTLLVIILLGIALFLFPTTAAVTPDNAEVAAVESPANETTTPLDEAGNIQTGVPIDVDSLFQQPEE